MSLVSKMKHNQANPNIQYLADLLAYFASIPNALYKNSYVTIKNENNQESFVLEKDVIENCLNDDYELLKYIQKFSEIEIKLQYPIDDFDTIYEYVKFLKSHCFTLKLRIFIAGTESTDLRFSCDEDISTVILDSSITEILSNDDKGSFEGCRSLESIIIPSTVNSIGDSAFYLCSKLAQITIPSSVKAIGKSAFCECSSLAQVTIPSSVTSIGGGAFCRCTSLTQVVNQSSIKTIERSTFCECESLVQINIPSSVTAIGGRAFYGCSSLVQIAVPSSVSSIGDDAFDKCSSMTHITLPSSIDASKLSLDSRVTVKKVNYG
ncbi:hypothetical protein M9Y10_032892 [Tritrichomonas musculus]|uniref:Surface antigen BspA-like n=1 Tax=Tritrichomonas musculus TaxID=1915356 RepID=A0ABR2H019_9EUKA